MINLSPPASRGLIKLAIKDQFGPFRAVETINYEEYKIIISNALKERLVNLGVSEPSSIIQFLTKELYDNQSVIIMSI